MNQPLVSIRCLVYNHEPYLRQCLDGFVMQKTSFAFEAIVHDDASTDGSAAIIREYAEKYPDIIKPIYEKENQYSKHDGSIRRIMNAAIHPAAKYIAMCEGDDYWIDPLKLQKQVDFLEANPEYGLVHTEVDQWYQKDGILIQNYNKTNNNKIPDGDVFEALMDPDKYLIKLPTVLFRRELILRTDQDEFRSALPSYDLAIWLNFSKYTKFKYLPDSTAVYRVLLNSMSNISGDARKRHMFHKQIQSIRRYYAEKYEVSTVVQYKLRIAELRSDFFDAIAMRDKELLKKTLPFMCKYKIQIGLKYWLYALYIYI